ncbi:hypothetical protein HAAEEKHM_00055 [Sinorhizobium phage AP-16-3]|nr:hypothetical protein HAAEEKHM_00055 [Sinorhizobium phage AP-16-3]
MASAEIAATILAVITPVGLAAVFAMLQHLRDDRAVKRRRVL